MGKRKIKRVVVKVAATIHEAGPLGDELLRFTQERTVERDEIEMDTALRNAWDQVFGQITLETIHIEEKDEKEETTYES